MRADLLILDAAEPAHSLRAIQAHNPNHDPPDDRRRAAALLRLAAQQSDHEANVLELGQEPGPGLAARIADRLIEDGWIATAPSRPTAAAAELIAPALSAAIAEELTPTKETR